MAATQVAYGERYGWTVVQVRGEVGPAGVSALRNRLLGLVAGGCRQLVVDLGRLEFCDSTGFAVLVAARRELSRYGGRLRLVLPGPSSPVRAVLASFGVERIFDVHESTADALAEFRADLPGRPGAVESLAPDAPAPAE